MKTFPVADHISPSEWETLGLLKGQTSLLRAIATGEKRCPKAGEWFLSGAIVEAYKARADMSTPYYIARLARVRTETVEVIERVL